MLLGPDGALLATFPLIAEDTQVGTQGEVRLTDPFASALQGRLVFRGSSLSFAPERTNNGSFLLLKREIEIRPGREFRAGRQLLRIDPFKPVPAPVDRLWGSHNPGYRYQVQQILNGGAEGDVFPLREGENLIGRTAGDLSFPGDGYVSSRHGVLTVRGDRITLKDIGSSNGTFVKIEAESNIDPGDLILIGEQLLRIDPP